MTVGKRTTARNTSRLVRVIHIKEPADQICMNAHDHPFFNDHTAKRQGGNAGRSRKTPRPHREKDGSDVSTGGLDHFPGLIWGLLHDPRVCREIRHASRRRDKVDAGYSKGAE
jgi:hypothetical protein